MNHFTFLALAPYLTHKVHLVNSSYSFASFCYISCRIVEGLLSGRGISVWVSGEGEGGWDKPDSGELLSRATEQQLLVFQTQLHGSLRGRMFFILGWVKQPTP